MFSLYLKNYNYYVSTFCLSFLSIFIFWNSVWVCVNILFLSSNLFHISHIVVSLWCILCNFSRYIIINSLCWCVYCLTIDWAFNFNSYIFIFRCFTSPQIYGLMALNWLSCDGIPYFFKHFIHVCPKFIKLPYYMSMQILLGIEICSLLFLLTF